MEYLQSVGFELNISFPKFKTEIKTYYLHNEIDYIPADIITWVTMLLWISVFPIYYILAVCVCIFMCVSIMCIMV